MYDSCVCGIGRFDVETPTHCCCSVYHKYETLVYHHFARALSSPLAAGTRSQSVSCWTDRKKPESFLCVLFIGGVCL